MMIAVATTAALLAVVGCGDPAKGDRQVASLSSTDGSNTETDATGTVEANPKDPAEAALAFAKCMRDHGVDMPDPVVQDDSGSGGGVMVQVGGPGGDAAVPDRSVMDAANKDCQHFMTDAAGSFDPPSPEELEKMKEQALAFAKCMREHGVDMPDPQFDDNGAFSVSIGVQGPGGTGPQTNGNGPAVDPTSKEFQDANTACGVGNGGAIGFSVGTVNG
jgi:hypothetical protein